MPDEKMPWENYEDGEIDKEAERAAKIMEKFCKMMGNTQKEVMSEATKEYVNLTTPPSTTFSPSNYALIRTGATEQEIILDTWHLLSEETKHKCKIEAYDAAIGKIALLRQAEGMKNAEAKDMLLAFANSEIGEKMRLMLREWETMSIDEIIGRIKESKDFDCYKEMLKSLNQKSFAQDSKIGQVIDAIKKM